MVDAMKAVTFVTDADKDSNKKISEEEAIKALGGSSGKAELTHEKKEEIDGFITEASKDATHGDTAKDFAKTLAKLVADGKVTVKPPALISADVVDELIKDAKREEAVVPTYVNDDIEKNKDKTAVDIPALKIDANLTVKAMVGKDKKIYLYLIGKDKTAVMPLDIKKVNAELKKADLPPLQFNSDHYKNMYEVITAEKEDKAFLESLQNKKAISLINMYARFAASIDSRYGTGSTKFKDTFETSPKRFNDKVIKEMVLKDKAKVGEWKDGDIRVLAPPDD